MFFFVCTSMYPSPLRWIHGRTLKGRVLVKLMNSSAASHFGEDRRRCRWTANPAVPHVGVRVQFFRWPVLQYLSEWHLRMRPLSIRPDGRANGAALPTAHIQHHQPRSLLEPRGSGLAGAEWGEVYGLELVSQLLHHQTPVILIDLLK